MNNFDNFEFCKNESLLSFIHQMNDQMIFKNMTYVHPDINTKTHGSVESNVVREVKNCDSKKESHLK